MNILAIAGLLLASTTVTAADALRLACIAEIKNVAPAIRPTDVQIPGVPPLLRPLQSVMLRRATYHPETKQWQLWLQCVPRSACLPFIAVVRRADPTLLPGMHLTHPAAPAVRAGDRKEMSATFGAVRLRQYVICLQSGRPGDSIRVRPQGEDRVLLASVGPNGSLIAKEHR
jgi:hypothetical protein